MPLRIAYHEPDKDIRYVTELNMLLNGHSVMTVASTAEALELFSSKGADSFDLAILTFDFFDRKIDVTKLSLQLRDEFKVPVIIIANIIVPESHGAQRVLLKPILPDDLETAIERLAPIRS